MNTILTTFIILLVIGIFILAKPTGEEITLQENTENIKTSMENNMEESDKMEKETKEAIFAGGCFWCIEAAFQEIPGVIEAISGYTGGDVENPTYEQVSSGQTGHFEGVRVIYNPDEVSYKELVEFFWTFIDPTDAEGQFADKGSQYKTAIFYANDEEKQTAESSKQALQNSGKFAEAIATQILPVAPFYDAEEYHQDFSKKRTAHYKLYEKGSGRKDKLEELWG